MVGIFSGYQEFANLLLPSDLSDEVGKELEVFELIFYCRRRSEESIDESKNNLVLHQVCPPETLPSTSATLRELSLGALLAAGHV